MNCDKHPATGGFDVNSCEACGNSIKVGDWPWCPHEPAPHFGEEPLEPYWDEHISPQGAHLTTRSERRRIMAAGGLEYHDVSRKRRGRFYVDMGR